MSMQSKNGFTIIEIVIALLIFSFTFTSVLYFMANGDKINGKRLQLSNATMLATNQIEKIKEQETSPVLLDDTTYNEAMGNFTYTIDRIRIFPPSHTIIDTAIYHVEFSVSVSRQGQPAPLVTFRVLQGLSSHAK